MPILPSRSVSVSIFEDLATALYPCHYGPQDLDADDIDDYVERTLGAALNDLQEQIVYEQALNVGAKDHAAAIVEAFVASLPKIRAAADKDARASFAGDPSAISTDEVIVCYPGFAAVLRYRLAHELHRLGVPLIARIVSEDAHSRTGVDIHPAAQIGEGFFIDHGTGVVIGETAVIGRNVRLYQGVTLGAKRVEVKAAGEARRSFPRHPILEDDVVIYAGATVLGRVVIGRGSTIGGGVWITSSVPPGSHITQAIPRQDMFDNGGGI